MMQISRLKGFFLVHGIFLLLYAEGIILLVNAQGLSMVFGSTELGFEVQRLFIIIFLVYLGVYGNTFVSWRTKPFFTQYSRKTFIFIQLDIFLILIGLSSVFEAFYDYLFLGTDLPISNYGLYVVFFLVGIVGVNFVPSWHHPQLKSLFPSSSSSFSPLSPSTEGIVPLANTMCFYHPNLPAQNICVQCSRPICSNDAKEHRESYVEYNVTRNKFVIYCPPCDYDRLITDLYDRQRIDFKNVLMITGMIDVPVTIGLLIMVPRTLAKYDSGTVMITLLFVLLVIGLLNGLSMWSLYRAFIAQRIGIPTEIKSLELQKQEFLKKTS